MSNLPFIPFPKLESTDRAPGTQRGRGANIQTPGREAQTKRLGYRLKGLSGRLSSPEGLAELRNDPGSIAPERALVFELV